MESVIRFAAKEKLFIFADEVYQHNVYAEGSGFHSFKKVSWSNTPTPHRGFIVNSAGGQRDGGAL